MDRKVIVANYDVAYECGMRFESVNESSLKRIGKHIKNGFITISVYRSELQGKTKEENERDHKELCSIVRGKGFGFITILGGYKGPDGEFVREVGLFIPYQSEVMSEEEFDEFGRSLCEKYKQDEYIVGNAEGVMLSKDKNGKIIKKYTNMTTEKDFSEYYSALKKGRDRNVKYVFEGIRTWNGVYSAKNAFDSGEIV